MRGKRAYPWVMYKDEKLSKEYLTDLLYIIANTYELEFDPLQGSPFVYATIPGDHRFSAICDGKMIQSSFFVAIQFLRQKQKTNSHNQCDYQSYDSSYPGLFIGKKRIDSKRCHKTERHHNHIYV